MPWIANCGQNDWKLVARLPEGEGGQYGQQSAWVVYSVAAINRPSCGSHRALAHLRRQPHAPRIVAAAADGSQVGVAWTASCVASSRHHTH